MKYFWELNLCRQYKRSHAFGILMFSVNIAFVI